MAYKTITFRQAAVDQADIKVSPTIIIGLGGTGQQVLMKIRRLFAEQYGSLEAIPIVKYLYIDTDKAPASQEDLTRDNDPFLSAIDFTPAETLKLSVNVSEYIRNINNYPFIKKWLKTTGKIAELGDLEEGAGQVRSASRLAFFEHFNEIRDKLTGALSVYDTAHQELMREMNVDVDYSSLFVYVITSLAGGTGSGIFLDMGCLLKHVYEDRSPSVIGYAVLPAVYSNYGARTQANGYASIKELDHYNFKNLFAPQWNASFEDVKFSPPPYSFFYLVDSQCEGGATVTPNTRPQLYDMLAENVFQDFGNSIFASFKRTTKVNLKQYLNDLYGFTHLDADGKEVLQETFSCRYSAFGLSLIRFPALRIKHACAFKLAADVIAQWGTEWKTERYGEIDKEIQNNVLPKLNILEGERSTVTHGVERVSQLITRIDTDESGNLSFAAKIDRTVEALRSDILHEEGQYREFFLTQRAKIEHALRGEESENQADWGDWLNVLRKNSDTVTDEVTTELASLFGTYATNPEFGVGFIITLAERIKNFLSGKGMENNPAANKYIPYFRQEMDTIDTEIKQCGKELNDFVHELGEIEHRGGLFVVGHRKPALRRQIHTVIDNFAMFLKLRVEKLLRRNAIAICEGIIEKIGSRIDQGEDVEFSGLLRTYQLLFENIGDMQRYCDRMYKYFKMKNDTPMIRNLYDPEELDNQYYPKYAGKGDIYKQNLGRHSAEVMRVLGLETLDQLVDVIISDGVAEVGRKIMEYTMELFEPIENDYNVLEIFKKKHGLDREIIRIAIANGQPWVKPSPRTGNYQFDQEQKRYYIGVPEMPGSTLPAEFMQVAHNIDPSLIQKPLGNKADIVFFSEAAGFPAFYVNGIGTLKEAYNNHMINKEQDIHTTKEQYKFKDLMFFSDEKRQKWLACHRAYLLGSIMNILRSEFDKEYGEAIYGFEHERDFGNSIDFDLGTESRSVVYMFDSKLDRGIHDMILTKVEEKKDQLGDLDKIASLIAAFMYYQKKVYPIERREAGGGAADMVVSLQHSILEEEVQALASLAKDFGIETSGLRDRAKQIYEGLMSGKVPPYLTNDRASGRLRMSI
jgi:hypothetical protein